MRLFPLMAVASLALAGPAMARCPSPDPVDKICKIGADLASELSRKMPVTGDTLRFSFAVGTLDGLAVAAEPVDASTPADPAEAAEYLCDVDAVRDFLSSGGVVDVLLSGAPFLTLADCEAP